MTFNWHYILNATNSCMAPLTSFCTWLSIFICCCCSTFTLAITNHKRLEAGVKKAVIMGFSWDDRICVKSIKYWLTKNVFYSRASCSEKMAADSVSVCGLWISSDVEWCALECINPSPKHKMQSKYDRTLLKYISKQCYSCTFRERHLFQYFVLETLMRIYDVLTNCSMMKDEG